MNAAATTTSSAPVSERLAVRGVRPAIILAALWGGLIALWHSYQLEPITGPGWIALLSLVGLNLLLGFGIAWAFLSRVCLLGCALLPLMFLVLPTHSKAGARITVANETASATEVRISPADHTDRSATLNVAAGSRMTHRTAPGDYSETIEVEFVVGASRLIASIGQLRTNQVAVTTGGLRLVELRRGEP